MLTETKTETLADPLDDVLGYQLRRAMLVTMTALTDSYEELDLKVSEAIILRFVGANPGCNQSAIGRALGVKRTNMVPIVAGLEARSLLIRPPADGRSNALFLTEAGKELLKHIQSAGDAIEQHFFGDIAPDTRNTLLELCRNVRAKAEGTFGLPGGSVNAITNP